MRFLTIRSAFCVLAMVIVVALALLAGCSTASRSGAGLSAPIPARAVSTAPTIDVLKAADAPPDGEANRVTTLAYHLDVSDNTILTWRYRMLGDYNLTLNVDVSDITPIAMHFGETWDPVTSPDSAASVVDGSGNFTVGVEDITQIAMNYNRTCASYSIRGAATVAGPYTEVGNAPCPTGSLTANGWPEMTFDLGLTPAYAWYEVIPLDTEGNPGIASLPVHIVPGGGGGLILSLVSTPVSGAGIAADPYVIITATLYEVAVENQQGTPITTGVSLSVQPPFIASVTSSTPFMVIHSGALTGDFYVVATAGSLTSNRLYFRVPGTP